MSAILDLRPRTLLGLIGENGVSALAASVVQNRSVSEPGVGTAFPQLMVGSPVPPKPMRNRRNVLCLNALTRNGAIGEDVLENIVDLTPREIPTGDLGAELVTAFLQMMVSSLVVRQLMKRERNAICLNAPTLSGEIGQNVPENIVVPIQREIPMRGIGAELVTAFLMMMVSLPAVKQLMKRGRNVICLNALTLTGENGLNVQENSVELGKLAPGQEHEIAFLQMMVSITAPGEIEQMRKKAPVTCLSAHSQNGENGEHVLASFVTALGPTLGLVTVSLRMMAAMDARCQMRKSRVPVTCQRATGLIGESGVCAEAQTVGRQAL